MSQNTSDILNIDIFSLFTILHASFSSSPIRSFSNPFHGDLVWLLCSLILASLSAAWFRLKLAQLRRPPLPPSPPALPVVGHLHLIGPVPHRTFHKFSQKYGPIFLLRLGIKPTLVISSPALAKQFLHDHDHSFAHRPPSVFADIVFHGSQVAGFMQQTARWRALRKLYMQQILSAKNVTVSRKVRDEEMGTLLQKLRKRSGSQVEIREVVFDWVLNVTTRVLFSDRAEGQLLEFRAAFRDLSDLFGQPLVADFVPYLRRLIDPGGLLKKVVREAARMDAIVESVVSKRLAELAHSEAAPPDVLTTLLEFEGLICIEGSKSGVVSTSSTILTSKMDSHKGAVKAILLELLMASTDTTTVIVEWAMAELLRSPEVKLRRLQAELEAVMGAAGAEQVEESHFGNLPYLQAVMKEALRLHPPASTLLPHFSKEATEVAGYFIPENTMLVVNAWSIGRDESVWEDAHEFKPERFLAGGSDSDITLGGQSNYQLLAFGHGRRGCPGRNLGLTMASLALANLVHSFDLQTSTLPELEEVISAVNMLAQPLVPTLFLRRSNQVERPSS